jgi:hypothetical protein
MAKEKDSAELVSVAGLAEALAMALKSAQPKELKEGDPEYVARQTAEGWFDTFEKPVFQNAYAANPRMWSAESRARVVQLRPGKYLKGRVTVEVNERGVYLKYPVLGDNMMKNQQYWRDIDDLVGQLWDEMHAPVPA